MPHADSSRDPACCCVRATGSDQEPTGHTLTQIKVHPAEPLTPKGCYSVCSHTWLPCFLWDTRKCFCVYTHTHTHTCVAHQIKMESCFHSFSHKYLTANGQPFSKAERTSHSQNCCTAPILLVTDTWPLHKSLLFDDICRTVPRTLGVEG